MLSLVSSTVATLVTLLALLLVAPRFAAFILRFALRGFGWWIEKRSRGRRELIRSRVRAEEELYRSKKFSPPTAEDEDWEKVDSHRLSTASSASASGESWQGIVGFFHPFW